MVVFSLPRTYTRFFHELVSKEYPLLLPKRRRRASTGKRTWTWKRFARPGPPQSASSRCPRPDQGLRWASETLKKDADGDEAHEFLEVEQR